MIELLISFIIFIAVVVVVAYVWRWLCTTFAFGEPIQRVGLFVLGVIALIIFLRRFVQPLVA